MTGTPPVDLELVKGRLKALRARLSLPQHEVARDMGEPRVPPRTFQSWEDGEVQTSLANYDRLAAYYSEKLGEEITATWILYGLGPDDLSVEALRFAEDRPPTVAALQRELATLRIEMDDRLAALRSELLAGMGQAQSEPEAPASLLPPSGQSSEAERT